MVNDFYGRVNYGNRTKDEHHVMVRSNLVYGSLVLSLVIRLCIGGKTQSE